MSDVIEETKRHEAPEAGAGGADAAADQHCDAGGKAPSRRMLASAAAVVALLSLLLRRSGGRSEPETRVGINPAFKRGGMKGSN